MNDRRIDTLESAIRHINTAQWQKTYLCDPRKNVRCPKGSTCFMNGGPCQETTREEYATDPVTQAALMGYIVTEDE